MARTAACLKRRSRARKALPSLLVFTDPARTPDPVALAHRIPRGAGLVYRAFGAEDAEAVARKLKAVARQRGLVLLIGADAKLAARVGAEGVHLPERLAWQAPSLARRGWIVTAAAHSAGAARVAGVDAVVTSAIFPSRSASAGKPIGPVRLAALLRNTPNPAYALGGVTNETARRLLPTGVVGIAAVDAFRT